jgi:hypothetical protein
VSVRLAGTNLLNFKKDDKICNLPLYAVSLPGSFLFHCFSVDLQRKIREPERAGMVPAFHVQMWSRVGFFTHVLKRRGTQSLLVFLSASIDFRL